MRDRIYADGFKAIADHVYGTGAFPSKGIVYCTSREMKECLKAMPHSGRYVLITREFDEPVNSYLASIMPPSLVAWFAQNVEVDHPLIKAFPYGMPTSIDFQDYMDQVLNRPRSETNLVLVCMGIPTFECESRGDRTEAMEVMRSKPYATILMDGGADSRVTPTDWYIALKAHPFVIAPCGVGSAKGGGDTMRWMEALYMGTIPILKRSYRVTRFFDDMPIARVDNWSDITPEWLETQRDLFQVRTLERTKLSYWIEQIKGIQL